MIGPLRSQNIVKSLAQLVLIHGQSLKTAHYYVVLYIVETGRPEVLKSVTRPRVLDRPSVWLCGSYTVPDCNGTELHCAPSSMCTMAVDNVALYQLSGTELTYTFVVHNAALY